MEEWFDILDESGTSTGVRKLRSEVHRDGDLHGASHMWVISPKREDGSFDVLLQRRSHEKDSHPDQLDTSSAGHVSAGETFLSTAVRELQEELGLPVCAEDLTYLFQYRMEYVEEFHGQPFHDNEIHAVYVLRSNFPMEGLTFQREEISELVWMDSQEILRRLRAGSAEMCIILEEYERFLEELEKLQWNA
ncbi:MAG: NUDIX domain-containing protein [Lachnospiraceae bacterium]|nr:NUDIX domain-containing protein [Lachnospiraceae bacterium]